MKYSLFYNNNYPEVKEGKVLDEFYVTKEMFEEIATVGCNMFANLILGDEEYLCPVNEVVFSDETPFYDFDKTLEKIDLRTYELEFLIYAKLSFDALVREIKELKKESKNAYKNPHETICILLDRIKDFFVDNDDEISRGFKKELEELMQQISYHEIDEHTGLDEIYTLINRTLKIYQNTLKELRKLKSIDRSAYQIRILRLGEYKPATRTIVLYYKNIKKEETSAPDALMKIVFMHELMHALLHPFGSADNLYVEKLEEPICEYGALCLASFYQKGQLFNIAHKHIADKKKLVPLHHYGFGSYLYDREMLDTETRPCGRFVAALYLQKTRVLTAPTGSKMPRRSSFDILIDSFNEVFAGNKEYPRDSQNVLFDRLYRLKFEN